MVGWSIGVRLFCAALMVFSTVVAVAPADAQSGGETVVVRARGN